MVRLEFLGALSIVGSSGVLVETGSERIVFDYGTNIQELPPTFPHVVKGKIDAVFLSHAHLDHSGGLAILMKKNPCTIYAAAPSKQMVQMLLKDSLKIAKHEGIRLPFTTKDAQSAINNFKHIEYRKPITIGNTKAITYAAGHIPGSMMTFLRIGNNKTQASSKRKKRKYNTLLYTGDFNTKDTQLINGSDTRLPELDILITESTYADREHPDRKKQEKELIKIVQSTLANDGIAVVSNFAIGRTQEVLLILGKYGIDYPLYIDGMAKKATTIINGHPQALRDPTSLDKALRKVHYITNERQRAKIIKNPCVILTTSGMLSGGPVIYYLQKLYEDRRSSLTLSGFQVPGTPGHTLMETGRLPLEDCERKIHELKLKMSVRRLDFSSHVGRKEMFAFIERLNPKKIFCVHGDNTPKFARELRDKGFDATAPLPEKRVFDLA